MGLLEACLTVIAIGIIIWICYATICKHVWKPRVIDFPGHRKLSLVDRTKMMGRVDLLRMHNKPLSLFSSIQETKYDTYARLYVTKTCFRKLVENEIVHRAPTGRVGMVSNEKVDYLINYLSTYGPSYVQYFGEPCYDVLYPIHNRPAVWNVLLGINRDTLETQVRRIPSASTAAMARVVFGDADSQSDRSEESMSSSSRSQPYGKGRSVVPRLPLETLKPASDTTSDYQDSYNSSSENEGEHNAKRKSSGSDELEEAAESEVDEESDADEEEEEEEDDESVEVEDNKEDEENDDDDEDDDDAEAEAEEEEEEEEEGMDTYDETALPGTRSSHGSSLSQRSLSNHTVSIKIPPSNPQIHSEVEKFESAVDPSTTVSMHRDTPFSSPKSLIARNPLTVSSEDLLRFPSAAGMRKSFSSSESPQEMSTVVKGRVEQSHTQTKGHRSRHSQGSVDHALSPNSGAENMSEGPQWTDTRSAVKSSDLRTTALPKLNEPTKPSIVRTMGSRNNSGQVGTTSPVETSHSLSNTAVPAVGRGQRIGSRWSTDSRYGGGSVDMSGVGEGSDFMDSSRPVSMSMKLSRAAYRAKSQSSEVFASDLPSELQDPRRQMRNLIQYDVTRTHYRELSTNPQLQHDLVRLLHEWLDAEPSLEYRQGMLAVSSVIVILFKNQKNQLSILQNIVNRYYSAIQLPYTDLLAIIRLRMHDTLLSYYAPTVWERLHQLEVYPEIYAQSWFYTLFLCLCPMLQGCCVLDLLLSINDSDFILVCLSVCLFDQLRSFILRSSYDEIMLLFTDLNNNIPHVNLNEAITRALILYSSLPSCLFREFKAIEALVRNDREMSVDQVDNYALLRDITPQEFWYVLKKDKENLVIVDCSNEQKSATISNFGLENVRYVYNFTVDEITNFKYEKRRDAVFEQLSPHRYRFIIILVKHSSPDQVCLILLEQFKQRGFHRYFVYREDQLLFGEV